MSRRLKKIMVLLVTLLLAGGVYAWFYPLNKGALIITTDLPPYTIEEDERQTLCEQDPCEIILKSGLHHLRIRKEGYLAETLNVSVKRWQAEEASVELKKIPTLEPVETVPVETDKKQGLPTTLEGQALLAPTWGPSGQQLAYWSLKDERLKIWSEEDTRPVAALQNMEKDLEWHWSPNEKNLFGVMKTDLYFINIEKASRKKITAPFIPQHLTWSPDNNYLLANDTKNDLYKISGTERVITSLEKRLDLTKAVWEGTEALVYFTYNEEADETSILKFNPLKQETKTILKKTDFPIEKILEGKDKMIYLYNPADETWYQLTY